MEVLLIFKFFIFGHYWPFLAIFGHFWPFLGIFPSHDFGFLIFYYLSTNFSLMCLRIKTRAYLPQSKSGVEICPKMAKNGQKWPNIQTLKINIIILQGL